MRTGSVRREQTKTTCTQAELDDWVRSVEDLGIEDDQAQFVHRTRFIQGTFPPCLGCGRPVNAASGAALTVSMDSIIGVPFDPNEMTTIGTATFQPCGCVLRIQVRGEQAKRL